MKKIALIILSAAMLLSFAACGAEKEAPEELEDALEESQKLMEQAEHAADGAEGPAESEEIKPLPDSELYYGEVLEIKTAEDGSVTQLSMNSQAKGDMLMNISDETVFIDSGNFCADESEIKVGDRMYVFHSPAAAMSLPAQSAAFAIVRNIPMDARCAMYHEIEEVSRNKDGVVILTDNGETEISADGETEVSLYSGEKAGLKDIVPGGYMMVIYREVMNQAPENPEAFKIMLLN